jgi:hypothetical protein
MDRWRCVWDTMQLGLGACKAVCIVCAQCVKQVGAMRIVTVKGQEQSDILNYTGMEIVKHVWCSEHTISAAPRVFVEGHLYRQTAAGDTSTLRAISNSSYSKVR